MFFQIRKYLDGVVEILHTLVCMVDHVVNNLLIGLWAEIVELFCDVQKFPNGRGVHPVVTLFISCRNWMNIHYTIILIYQSIHFEGVRVFHIFICKLYTIIFYKYLIMVFLLKQNSRESPFKEYFEFYSFFIFLLQNLVQYSSSEIDRFICFSSQIHCTA